MKITKLVQSCLLVEMPEPINRTVLFDPGYMSEDDVNKLDLKFLDDIIITHNHQDHMSINLIKLLVQKFPNCKITTTPEAVNQLEAENIKATSQASEGIVFFSAPHEDVSPLFVNPEEIGVHYLNLLTHPGDSHSFSETRAILALPITAPWGSTINAIKLALQLKPKYILPIHDWHWHEQARKTMYDNLEKFFQERDINFIKLENTQPVVINTEGLE